MPDQPPVPLTAEEHELIALWCERPPEQRTLDQVPAYAAWVLAQRPGLLPKGRDDAAEYLLRLLGELVGDAPAAAAPPEPGA